MAFLALASTRLLAQLLEAVPKSARIASEEQILTANAFDVVASGQVARRTCSPSRFAPRKLCVDFPDRLEQLSKKSRGREGQKCHPEQRGHRRTAHTVVLPFFFHVTDTRHITVGQS